MTSEELMQIEKYLLDRKKPDYELSKKIMNACEKQMPKRINEYNRCPCCDTYNETIEKRKNTVTYDICYCWHCGQALDWRLQNDRCRD